MAELIDFSTKSLLSVNEKVVHHSAFVMFNTLLCYESENRSALDKLLQTAMKNIDELLGK